MVLPVVSATASILGLDANNYLCGDGLAGVRLGTDVGSDYLIGAPSAKATLFDDFTGDVIADQWSAAKGSDGQAVIATVVVPGGGTGVCRLTAGDTVTASESLSSLTGALNYKASNGGVILEARVKPVTSIANVSYFIGFTDVLATTTLEEPMTLSTATWTTNATDAVGFVFDTAGTVPGFHCMSVLNDVDQTPITNAVPVVDTYTVLRIELSTAGAATFYRDGTLIGTLATAVTASVALTPIVSVMARTTTVKSIDIDYIYAQQNRV